MQMKQRKTSDRDSTVGSSWSWLTTDAEDEDDTAVTDEDWCSKLVPEVAVCCCCCWNVADDGSSMNGNSDKIPATLWSSEGGIVDLKARFWATVNTLGGAPVTDEKLFFMKKMTVVFLTNKMFFEYLLPRRTSVAGDVVGGGRPRNGRRARARPRGCGRSTTALSGSGDHGCSDVIAVGATLTACRCGTVVPHRIPSGHLQLKDFSRHERDLER